MNKKLIAATVFGAAFLTGGQAFAFPSASGYEGIFYNNSEVLWDRDVGTPGGGQVSVGDIFWGTYNVQNIKDSWTITGQAGGDVWDGTSAPAEISGYFVQEVKATCLPGAPCAALGGMVNPYASALIVLGSASVDPNGIFSAADLAAGAMMRVFVDNANNYDDTFQTTALATATDGAVAFTLGDGASAETGNLAGYNYTLAPLVPPGAGDIGESYGGLNFVYDEAGIVVSSSVNDPNESLSAILTGIDGPNNPSDFGLPNPGTDVDFFFNSEIFALGSFGTPFGMLNADGSAMDGMYMHFGSNDPAVMNIPEPGTLALVGLGLFGAGWSRKSRRQAQK